MNTHNNNTLEINCGVEEKLEKNERDKMRELPRFINTILLLNT